MKYRLRILVVVTIATLLSLAAYILLNGLVDPTKLLQPDVSGGQKSPDASEQADSGTKEEEKSKKKTLRPLPAGVTVTNGTVKCSGGEAKVLTVLNFDKILDCERPTGSLALEVQLSHTENGIDATVWTRRGKMAFLIDGFDNVGRSEYKLSGTTGITPGVARPGDYDTGVLAVVITGYNNDTKAHDGPTLIITANKKRKVIPYEDCIIGDGIFVKGYPIAVFKKLVPSKGVSGQFQFASLVIIDSQKLAILGEIPVPKDATTAGISFVLDAKSNALIAVEQKLNWLMAIDLNQSDGQPMAGRSGALESSGN